MRDIPMFTTEYGIASLILREIPYRQEAYIRIRDTASPKAFLEECVAFCRMAGAENIYATGHAYLQAYPLHTRVLKMQRSMEALPQTDAMTMPVTEQTLEKWRDIYNAAMMPVDNASYMDQASAQALLERGNGYFIHRRGVLLGIGIASEDKIFGIVSVEKGAGQDVLLALTHALSADSMSLEVASTNIRALRLYEKLGFLPVQELSRWYRVS